ncbi:MAG: prolipoprotein diacylglyceryl transferase [Candidatus Uhrbacteria bacterium]|nr:prolipoprotein diacylglyceryl transferase [Candidatus Uhrbacteria bacterium]
MIPWFQFTQIHFGIITVQVWGLLVALGIFCATWVASKKAAREGLDPNIVWDFAFWVMISAFIGARLFEVVYNPALYLAHPLELLTVWQGGFSEMGGFIGAILALVYYLRSKKLDAWKYAGCVAYALPLGFGIGRIGCFLIHDHPGTLTHFILGVKYPDGIRHDHGLYLSIEGFLIFLLFVLLDRKHAKPQTFVITFLIFHGIIRFFLDFLRVIDIRYFFLTPAQYISIAMIFAGGTLLFPKRHH